ncbi:hypothetical protein PENDEC_c012G05634 [Penicillium decumbens]|uniref:Uncharacterized protein n=1 Tax=Penicillium decumbens TaxID=69771 RepID=A0A1V6PAQ6_PENDC|nr:hypothetical protein PENDEC_c012G05634 [Penicillium decumbens]
MPPSFSKPSSLKPSSFNPSSSKPSSSKPSSSKPSSSKPSSSKPSSSKPSSSKPSSSKPSSSKPSSSKPTESSTFELDREELFNSLMHQSRLIDEKPETYKSVAQYLVKVSSELDHFKRLALAELPKQTDGRKVPRCFPTRCDMIKEEMQKLSQGLANKSLPPSVGSLLTEMFAVQVGRLTLDGYSHSSTDNLPEIMERM